MTLRAVLLNDTSTRYHHGCARVMRLLVAGMQRHGLTISARSPARHDWARDAAFLQALEQADLVVINGEGTLHHGRPAGAALLAVVDHPACHAPVALVNALWQDNPADWSGLLSRLALRAARDSASAATMAAADAPARWLPDLSLSAPAAVSCGPRAGVIIGDSVRLRARQVLARAALVLPDARYLPTKTLAHPVWRSRIARSVLFRAYNGVACLRTPPFDMASDEGDYLTRLAAAEGQITGRFHAICLSMLTETPFLALASNASKIERLLTDAGLGTDRMVSAADLARPRMPPPFTTPEIAAVRAFRAMAAARSETLYADLATLARTR